MLLPETSPCDESDRHDDELDESGDQRQAGQAQAVEPQRRERQRAVIREGDHRHVLVLACDKRRQNAVSNAVQSRGTPNEAATLMPNISAPTTMIVRR